MTRRRRTPKLLSPLLPTRRPVRSKRVAIPRPPTNPGSGRWLPQVFAGPPGNRSYSVYLPAGVSRTAPAPMIVLLHGCGQSAVEFATATRFCQLADRQGCVLVFPQQSVAGNLNRCWNWFDARHQHRSVGEPAILAAITGLVATERLRWRIDLTRVYVAGLSAGGAMALTLGLTYPDLFAAVGVHSGPPFRSADNQSAALAAMGAHTPEPALPALVNGLHRPPPALIVIQGSADATVRGANADRIIRQWLACRAALSPPDDPDRVTRTRRSATTTGKRMSAVQRWYSARGRTVLECWLVSGLAHAWSGGLKGGSFSDPLGPRATTVMWRFFSGHRLAG